MTTRAPIRPTSASILVGVLWCLALLAIVVIGLLHTARLDLIVGKNYGDGVQAHYLALAGVEKAKALLFQDAKERNRSRQNHTGALQNSPKEFRDIAFGRGHFRVFRRGRNDEGGRLIYGVGDEGSRLNVNVATTNELAQLRGMTPDIVSAILDWRDADNAVTPGGAEAEYYSTLKPPGLPRNGPFLTIGELMMVRGITPELFRGETRLTEGANNGGDEESDGPTGAGLEDMGWSGIVTVDSAVKNVSASGDDRVNLQTADEAALTGIKGITSEIAKAIIAYRGQEQFNNIADLLDVPPAQSQNANRSQTSRPTGAQGGSASNAGGANGAIKSASERLGCPAVFFICWRKNSNCVTSDSLSTSIVSCAILLAGQNPTTPLALNHFSSMICCNSFFASL